MSREPGASAGTVGFACLAMLVSYLPFSAATGLLGAIGGTTGADTSDLQWVTDSFAVAVGATVLSAGVLGDLYGRQRVAVHGLTLTTAGTMLALVGGATTDIRLLWAGQALAGIGGGLVMSATLALVASRPRAIPLWGAAVVVGLGGGPFIASAVTGFAAWQWTFAPIGALAALSLLTVAADTGLGGFAWRLSVLGAGSGLVMATSSTVAVRAVAGPLAGMAGAGNNAMCQLGAALGPAVLGALVASRTGTALLGAVHLAAAVLLVVFTTAALTATLLLHTAALERTA